MRITFLQHGNYAATVERFSKGLGETYYAQRYSVEYVADLASKYDDVSVITLNGPGGERLLSNGVYWVGLDQTASSSPNSIIQVIEGRSPTHLILRCPVSSVLKWAITENVRTLPLLADSFNYGSILKVKRRLSFYRLAKLLNSPKIDWVANHNVPAANDLARIGVHSAKIIAWDWPALITPAEHSPKSGQHLSKPVKILYVGTISHAKGTFDLIEALSLLNSAQRNYTLTVVGSGQKSLEERVRKIGLCESVTLAGQVAHDDVIGLMRSHDVVVVPSRHCYPEGLPMTLYGGLCSRTPLVISDHPMFISKFRQREDAMVFKASNSRSLAEMVAELVNDPTCYTRLSENAQQTWERLRCTVEWGELLERWVRNNPDDRSWLESQTIG